MPQELRKELIGLLNYLDWNYAGETHEDRVRQYLEATERIGEAGIKPDVRQQSNGQKSNKIFMNGKTNART